ncbi:MAG: chemotaxis-specific protein-glutamate methyltransferase CheB [Bdellovibrionales bacterium]|nr:chemotaxis-specific protein-glutamate methyltransferase CheB [Bdellovibrionales bacterium]
MKTIKVLITDDSLVYRSQIKAALANLSGIEIVGVASNGRLALERINQLEVDLMILDMEMPEMDGLETLKRLALMEVKPKVLVFSSISNRSADVTLKALKLGATDFVVKPSGLGNFSNADVILEPSVVIRNLLEPKIRSIFFESKRDVVASPAKETSVVDVLPLSRKKEYISQTIWELFKPKILVIGASTGGPTVLEQVFTQIGPPLQCPILIVQHMPPVFTATFAKRLQNLSGLPVEEAPHGAILDKNSVYIAPGDYHMSLSRQGSKIKVNLDQSPQVNSVRPAVDPLFSSAAEIYKNQCLGIVFTGMGEDGKLGAESIKQNGGSVIIQNQASCVVFGMPGAVKGVGAFDFEMTPEQIIHTLRDKVASTNLSTKSNAVGVG